MLWLARVVRGVVLWSAWAIVALLVLGGIAVGVVETAWAKDQLRALIVRQVESRNWYAPLAVLRGFFA